jgi:cytochrome c oxidase cbb3-type subunit 3/ubiquinol-cytochrome c reductase cytochrome c subunit
VGTEVPPYAAALGDRERGKAVFATACAGCHGGDGRGGPKAGAVADPSYLALVSDQHLRTTVLAGRADLGMPDWRGYIQGRALAPGEISDVVAWLAAQRRPVPGRPGGE